MNDKVRPQPSLPRIAVVGLILTVLTIGAFWQLKDNGFINYDDVAYVTENPQVQTGLSRSGLLWAFSATTAGYWHPLTWLSHMLDWQLFGSDPRGHHLASLLFHLVNTLLLFLVLVRLTRRLWPSALVAALFALHPLHVESVAWASERKDVLSAFFWLLTMWAYLRYVERPGAWRYGLIMLSFALGLMAKPMVVTEPFVLLLLDYWPLERWPTRQTATAGHRKGKKPPELKRGLTASHLIWEKAPLFILALTSCLITLQAQKATIASIASLPVGARLGNALVSYVRYLLLMLWPHNLAFFYPYSGSSLAWWQIAGAGPLLAGICVLVIRWGRRFPYLPVGWFWYLGTMVPVIGLVQVGWQAMADRYTYIPLIGIFIILAFGAVDLATGRRRRQMALAGSFGLALLACLILTWRQVGYWRDSDTIYSRALDVTENNYVAYNNLGSTYAEAGRHDEAMAMFQQAIRYNPKYYDAYNNLGLIYDEAGRHDEAMAMFQQAIRYNPTFADAYNNLGFNLAGRGDLSAAISMFQQAIRLQPNVKKARYNLGLAYLKQRRVGEAREIFEDALKVDPANANPNNMAAACNNLATDLADAGENAFAILFFQEAIRLQPDYDQAYYNLGLVYLKQDMIRETREMLETALKKNPDNAGAREMLGSIKDR